MHLYTASEPWKRIRGKRGGVGKPALEYRGFGQSGCFLVHMLKELLVANSLLRGTTVVSDRAFTSMTLIDWLVAQ
eukprot:7413543-Pyramimonas_sp.AAC.1